MSTIKKYKLWVIYLLIGTLMAIILTIDDYLNGLETEETLIEGFFTDLVLIVPFISVMGYMASRFIHFLDRKWSWRDHFVIRTSANILFLGIVSFVISVSYMIADSVFNFNLVDTEQTDVLAVTFAIFLIIFLILSIVIIFHEFMNSLKTQEDLSLQSEILRRKNIEAEYQMLKNQISPHFLFNNLSVLSSLVYKDPEKSDEFIKEFSQIFRYILELKNETVVKVSKELHFLDSYIYLLKMRFESSIEFDQNISVDKLDFLLPPLSTQFLIENAVKHNRIDAKNHLKVEIFIEGDYLIIRNNLKARTEDVPSTGQGLKNLTDKYLIICDKSPQFGAVNGHYVAKIPLITPEDA